MTKEQEVIENLTDLLKQRNEKQVQITTYDLFENIETVLNMLKEKDKEIEEYKRMIATGIINAAKDELVQEKNKEIEKKDKQINLIINAVYKRFKAELLLEYGFENEEQFKQYFERKSEE